jgi:hypothetical protein
MQIITGKTKAPMRVIIHGAEGLGKSTFAAQAPRPIFIQTEDGLARIGPDRFPIARSLNDVYAQIKHLLDTEHDYQTLAIDSLDWLEPLVWAETCSRHYEPDIFGLNQSSKFSFGKGYDKAVETWNELLKGLDKIVERGMHVILIAHSASQRIEDPESGAYERLQPKVHKKACARLTEWADYIVHPFVKLRTQKYSQAPGSKAMAVEMEDGARFLRVNGSPAVLAKSRSHIPTESIPFPMKSWETFYKTVEKAENGTV